MLLFEGKIFPTFYAIHQTISESAFSRFTCELIEFKVLRAE